MTERKWLGLLCAVSLATWIGVFLWVGITQPTSPNLALGLFMIETILTIGWAFSAAALDTGW